MRRAKIEPTPVEIGITADFSRALYRALTRYRPTGVGPEDRAIGDALGLQRQTVAHWRAGTQPLRMRGCWQNMTRAVAAGWPRMEVTLDTHQLPGITVHEASGRQTFIPAVESDERQQPT